jgi:uncharacterized membrane protein HdeD (DUF308 family)
VAKPTLAGMTIAQSPPLFRHLWKARLASGLIALALGIVVLVWPGPSILVAAVLFGLFLVLSGIVELVFAFTLDVSVGHRMLFFITGALSVTLGVLAFRHFGQGYAVLLLAVWIGVALIFQGVSELTLAISHREIPGRGWLVFGGVISDLAGIVVIAWPFSSIIALALVTGIWLVIIGIARIVSAFRARKVANAVERGFERLTTAASSQGR